MTYQSAGRVPIRVLHLISEMGTGGAESLVVEMCRRSADVNWQSAVASSGGKSAELVASQHLATMYDVPNASRSAGGVFQAITATRSAMNSFSPDVVLAHNVGVSLIGGLARLPRRSPPMVSVFHGVSQEDYVNSARILSLMPDHVIPVSVRIAERLQNAGLRRTPMTVIPNAVSAPTLMDQAQARRELDLDVAQPVVLCAARIVPQKRHDVLLEAWAKGPRGMLLIAGDGPDMSAVRAQAERLGLGHDRVRFLGVRHDMPRLLSACDLTVLASDWEGLPMTTLESLAAGRPMVATNVDGLAESVSAGARLVPRRDPDALAAALTHLLQDPQERQDLAERGRTEILTKHDPAAMITRYDEILRAQL